MPFPPSAKAVEGLEPRRVWEFFAELSAVPRPSKHEEQVRQHAKQVAARLGFATREDRVGNLLMTVPATKGREKAPITVLQGHLDMVCEKNSGTQHDFDHDPIRLVLDRDAQGEPIVRADGTTLGADNGIGVCLALAAATDPQVTHGPLEILCTSDEEMGMTGAKSLTPEFFKGRRMLNLDSEEDEALYIGCAGGMDTTLAWQLPLVSFPMGCDVARVVVSGLTGGHSGGDIHLNRGNAIKLLVQTLRTVQGHDPRLVSLTGGSKRNAIPREAEAVVTAPAGLMQALNVAAEAVQAEARARGENQCTIRVESAPAKAAVSAPDSTRVLAALAALPHGVLETVPDIPGLVQTSNGTSTVECTTTDGALRLLVGCLSRSSVRRALHVTARQIAAVGELANAVVEAGNEYPGWAPNVKSPLLAVCKRVFSQQCGREPKVTAIHAGLECGLIGERIGESNIDMVSFGPHIEGAHSPDERVWVKSVEKTYRLLGAVLAELAR